MMDWAARRFGAATDVEARGDLYYVKGGDPGGSGQGTHECQQVSGDDSTDYDVGGAGGVTGIDYADVEADVDGVTAVSGEFEGTVGGGLGAVFFQGVGGDYGDAPVSGVVPFAIWDVALDSDADGVLSVDVAGVEDAAEGSTGPVGAVGGVGFGEGELAGYADEADVLAYTFGKAADEREGDEAVAAEGYGEAA